jgi:hypothetical protein
MCNVQDDVPSLVLQAGKAAGKAKDATVKDASKAKDAVVKESSRVADKTGSAASKAADKTGKAVSKAADKVGFHPLRMSDIGQQSQCCSGTRQGEP